MDNMSIMAIGGSMNAMATHGCRAIGKNMEGGEKDGYLGIGGEIKKSKAWKIPRLYFLNITTHSSMPHLSSPVFWAGLFSNSYHKAQKMPANRYGINALMEVAILLTERNLK